MADSLIQAELLAACSGLGYSDGVKYYREADCLETVKDLIRYLRRDDDSHQIRRALGETKVLQTDLIPLIKFHSEEKELFDVALRLLVNLTNPVLLLFKEELPEEKITRQQYLQMIGHQQSFKEAFADEKVWSILVGRLGEILNKDWEEREEEERLVVERILILTRNVLAVAPSSDEEKRTDGDASVHDQVLWALHLARFEDLILYISSSNNEQDLCMHVIEIISFMLKEQNSSELGIAGLQRSEAEKERDRKELMEMRRRETLAKQQKIKSSSTTRHSRFGGTYYVMNMKSISENNMIVHKHVSSLESLSFDQSKRSKKIPKNRVPLQDVDYTRKSPLAIRLFLQEFCIEFLNGAFNSLMYIVKDNLNRAKAQEHDEIYYLWAIKFFLEFNRVHNFKVELITEVLNVHTFHYIQTQMESYYETMTTDKKKIPLWSRRMHKGLKAYQELLMTLSYMDKSDNLDVRESSKILKNKVFYVIEYRELVLILLQNFDELKMTKSYLRDLIETTHVFLKLLEGLCGKQRHLLVQKKVKNKKSKKRPVSKPSAPAPLTEEELVMRWEEQSDTLFAVISGDVGELPQTFPYDPVSDLPEEEQKEIAMKRINRLLRNNDLKEAVSSLRSSREIWPEGDIFGASNLEPLEESLCLRMIFMANINNEEEISNVNDEFPEEEEEDSDEEQEKQEYQFSEQEFDYRGFIRRFAHIKVVQSYCLIFRNYFTNTENVNHNILRMFHRLALDCKLTAIFFQASLFKTFHMILEDPGASMSCHKDAVNFIKYIFRKFLQVSEENKKVFVELFFWKTNKEALEIECGYGTNDSNETKNTWTEEEDDEVRRLYMEFKDVTCEGKDVADLITENLINQNRTRRMVIKKMKDLNIISDIKELRKKTVKVRESQQWTEEQLMELRTLVEEYRDAIHPIARIMDHMSIKRPKHRVIDKIMELNLVENRRELQKKRESKKNSHGENFLRANESSGEESEENADDERNEDNDESVRDSESDSIVDDRSTRKSKETSAKRYKSLPVPTPAVISSSLSKVMENGWRDAVDWLAELLEETADEREKDGDFEPIPLITVTDICNRAMEDDGFLDFLRVVGVNPPRNHQEMFWRIPSNISIDGLRKRAIFLRQGLNGELGGQEAEEAGSNLPNEIIEEEHGSSEDDTSVHVQNDNNWDEELDDENLSSRVPENVLQNVENTLENRKKRLLGLVEKKKHKNTKKRRIVVENTDDDTEDTLRLHLDTEPTQENEPIYNNAIQSRFYDSDEETSRGITKQKVAVSDDVSSLKRKTAVLSDDDDSSPIKVSRKIIVMSDDDDDSSPIKVLRKTIVMSDDDDDDSSSIKMSRKTILMSDDDDAAVIVSKPRKFSRLHAIEDSDDE